MFITHYQYIVCDMLEQFENTRRLENNAVVLIAQCGFPRL